MKCNYWLFATLICLAGATVNQAWGVVVLEYDFRTAATNANAALNQATIAANGGSPDADLLQGGNPAVINNTATALGAGYDPRVATGYLSVRPVAGNNNDQALGTANKTNSIDHLMKQYMGDTTFSTGSVVMVIKPQFEGLDGTRRTFFWHGSSNSSNNMVWLLNDDDLKGPALHRNNTAVFPNPANNVLVSLPNVSWDADTWYLLGASWKANDEVDAENVLYLRPLNPLGTALASIQDTNLLDGLAPMDQPLYLGRRADSQEESGNSDIALFQLYNNALTVDDFNGLYNELALIPEPASLQLFYLAVAAWAWCARRRHSHSRA